MGKWLKIDIKPTTEWRIIYGGIVLITALVAAAIVYVLMR